MNHWLVKSEPDTYSFDDLKKDTTTMWDGVRNYGACNNLRAMKKGDQVFFYHSNKGKDIVGIAKVVKEAYPDPTAKKSEQDTWSVVDLEYVKRLNNPVTLEQIKAAKSLQDMVLVNNSRLSVQPVKKKEFETVLKMGV